MVLDNAVYVGVAIKMTESTGGVSAYNIKIERAMYSPGTDRTHTVWFMQEKLRLQFLDNVFGDFPRRICMRTK